MAKLTTDEVKHVAKLSKLNLTSEEIKIYTPQLEKIIEYVGSLQEVNTDGIEPTSQTTGLTNVERKDEIKTQDNIGLSIHYKVPAILEGRTNK